MTMRNTLVLSICLAFVICLLTPIVMADNWPRFRGPNGQGISGAKGIPVKWTEEDFAWELELDGIGHSSPVIWEDKVFVTFADKEAGRCSLMAVGLDDGEVLWRKDFTLAPVKTTTFNSQATATPAVDAEFVYVIWYGAEQTLVVALDHNGEEKWKKDFGPTFTQHGPGASLVVHDDIVVFPLGQETNDIGLQSFCYALDRHSGQTKWRLERNNSGNGSSSTPCVYRTKSGKDLLVFSSRAHGLSAVDPETGTVAWEVASAVTARGVSSPVLANGLILTTCGKGGRGVQLAAVRPPNDDSSKAHLEYSVDGNFVPYVPTPIAVGELLFIFGDHGLVSCIESKSGRVLWSEKPGGKFQGSPVLVEGRLYCVSTDGKVVVVNASEEYKCLAVNPIGTDSQATPAIANGRLILRSLSHLRCVAAETAMKTSEDL